MKKGDTITIFYEQKRRNKKAISNPKILASLVTIKGKKYYSFLADDGRYYDSPREKSIELQQKDTPHI